MSESGIKTGLWIIGILAVLALICSLIAAVKQPVAGVSADQVKAIVDSAIAGISVEAPIVNLSSIEQRLDNLEVLVNEDKVWEKEAEQIATDEWSERDYKDIYKAINDIYNGTDDEIDERDDIIYVKVKDTDFEDMDADDKDGTVTQYLKVKYENINGDEVKKYLTVTTTIDEGEVEDQEIEETD